MYAETTAHRADAAGSSDESTPPPISPRRAPDEFAPTREQALSPSLRPWTPGDAPAFEMKFLLDEARAREVEGRMAWRLAPDPHCDPALSHAYRIATLYCDTPALEVYHRLGPHRRRKYRLRRYGDESLVFLERKTKRGERVRKRRVTIGAHELPALSAGSADPDWPGYWFQQQLLQRRMEPVCAVQYLRTAYVGAGDEGPLRLTFDRDVRTSLVRDWTLPPVGDGLPVLEGSVVCEFKFRGALPALFKEAIRELALEPGGVSKYRHCFQASGGGLIGSRGDA